MNTDIPVHVDGEPWLQSPCAITILKSALKVNFISKWPIKNKIIHFFLLSKRQQCLKKVK